MSYTLLATIMETQGEDTTQLMQKNLMIINGMNSMIAESIYKIKTQ
jgi:hypothetical protein